MQGLLQYMRTGASSPAEAVAHATLVCDTAVLKGDTEGDAAQLLPQGFRTTGGRGVVHGQVWFCSGTANVAWGRIRAPHVRWPWSTSSVPHLLIIPPCSQSPGAPPWHSSRFSHLVSNGGWGGTMGSRERWRCPRTITLPMPPAAARCVPFSPKYRVSMVLGASL